MVETEEVESLATLGQVHDPSLGRLRLQAEIGQQCPQPRERGVGLPPGSTHHHQVIGETDQPAVGATPCTVKLVQIDVSQQRGDHPALRSTGYRAPNLTIDQHTRTQDRAQQLQDGPITDPFLDRLHQLLVRNRLEAAGDIRLDHPMLALEGLIQQDLQRIVRRPFGPEPERARQEVSLKDRLEHDL